VVFWPRLHSLGGGGLPAEGWKVAPTLARHVRNGHGPIVVGVNRAGADHGAGEFPKGSGPPCFCEVSMGMNSGTTQTLDLPGATVAYDIRRNDATDEPPLFLVGSPMGAAGFTTLAGYFADRTVITYDPRGTERSQLTDPAGPISPEIAADDLHAVIQAVGGPVDMFANSGGAVHALALVAKHPQDVRKLVAHEPPLGSALPDREHVYAATAAIRETYRAKGFGAGMAHFIAVTSHRGPYTSELVAQPPPVPAMMGLAAEDDGSRTDPLLSQTVITTTHFEPNFDALRTAPTRVVVAAGAESAGEMAHRGASAVAERLGTEPAIFPSHHGGFLGGEYGWAGEPEAFAAKLREVLSEA
jgi:pimeloyl-ACP methyl ester carboxylesterase